MIILDTNIVSELMKPSPDKNLWQWFDTVENAPLFITSITVAELRYGVSVLPKGKRQTQLDREITGMINEQFSERVLDFNRVSAETYGVLMARLKGKGINIGQSDGMIAAIALVYDAQLITRNITDFEHCGLLLVNPFTKGIE